MYVVCPDFNSVHLDKEEDVRFVNDLASADACAASMSVKYPHAEIYIFRAVRKVKMVGKPAVNTYNIDEKGQVLPA